MQNDTETTARRVRIAARALARAGLVHAYGHCSARLEGGAFLVCPPVPMGLTPVGAPCDRVEIAEPLPAHILGEVRLHQQIYARRPEAGGVVRFMGPNMMALAALGRVPNARHGFGCYFQPGIGLWDDPQLVRDDFRAKGAIDAMGAGRAVLMRGNGAVVWGESLEAATVFAWYLEDMCRIELIALQTRLAETAPIILAPEAEARATRAGRIIERMWDHLTAGDPELDRA